ncbi:Dabb family protein [Pendulispora albinea]|uniref:Dabb family protein n=1 Tax=Pendulispora albinea TaxID=2741071 RepID=A0ABZ2LLS2_9BACT
MDRRQFLSRSLAAVSVAAMATPAMGRAAEEGNRMVIHIVLFKFMTTATSKAIDDLMAQVRALPKEIPGIVDVACGRNVSPRSQAYTHAITLRFRNRAALDAFYAHPAHLRLIRESIKPIVSELLPVDYEDTPTHP